MEYNEVGTSRFRCTVTIHEAPHIQFGQDNTLSFAKKKDAKQFASKKAIDWLIASGFMPPDGSVRWPKPTPLPPSKVIGPKIPSGAQSIVAKSKNTFTAQIPPLAHKLGFSPPTYEITRVSEEAPLYNGHARWPNDPRISGKVGVVTNIYGQKNAKEMIAQEVFAFLTDIERQRTTQDEDTNGHAKVADGKTKEAKIEEDKAAETTGEVAIPEGTKVNDTGAGTIERNDITAKDTAKVEETEAEAIKNKEVTTSETTKVHENGAETIEEKEITIEETATVDEDRKRKRSLSQDPDNGVEKGGKSLKLGEPVCEQ